MVSKEKKRKNLAVRVLKSKAESVRQQLLAKNALASGLKPMRDEEFVYFPVSKRVALRGSVKFIKKIFAEEGKVKSLKELLAGKLSEKELEKVTRSFDIVGDIAVIQIPRELSRRKKIISRALLESNERIATVLVKKGGRKGVYRVLQLAWAAGKKNFSTIHKEYGCLYKVDLSKDYFSPRLSTERARIAAQVQPGERVLVLFAGVGPYAVLIAKRVPDARVTAVELNPHAARLLEENVRLNNLTNVQVVCGDARDALKKFSKQFDRIAMPLPKSAAGFLPLVLKNAAKGCVVHYYAFTRAKNSFVDVLKTLREESRKQGVKIAVLGKRVVVESAPGEVEVAVDFMIV